jgi:hypothetical protein
VGQAHALRAFDSQPASRVARGLPTAFGVREMNFHDFHLKGYSVLDSGRRIVLDLMYDYPDTKKEKSRIEFQGVVCYHFNHTTDAIITDIEEVTVEVTCG